MLPEEQCLRKISGDEIYMAPHGAPTAILERIAKSMRLVDGRLNIPQVATGREGHESLNVRGDFFRICLPSFCHPCQQFLARLLQSSQIGRASCRERV